jgi:hypothetical protein
MNRNAPALLFVLGILTARPSWAGETESIQPPLVESEVLGSEPAVPGGDPTGFEEVKGDIVQVSSAPENVQTGVPENDVIFTTQSPSNIRDTPEPSTLVLASVGAALMAARGCRRRRDDRAGSRI